jgi:hypothetical protein
MDFKDIRTCSLNRGMADPGCFIITLIKRCFNNCVVILLVDIYYGVIRTYLYFKFFGDLPIYTIRDETQCINVVTFRTCLINMAGNLNKAARRVMKGEGVGPFSESLMMARE